MDDNRNFLFAIALSVIVMVGWHMFFAAPRLERVKQQQQAEQQAREAQRQAAPGQPQKPDSSGAPQPGAGVTPGAAGPPPGAAVTPGAPVAVPVQTREAALAASPRLAIDTPGLKGSIALKGGRIDDLVLQKFRVSVKPDSAKVVLLSPASSQQGYYGEYGWVSGGGDKLKLPDEETLWSAPAGAVLAPGKPVTLVYDNGEGLIFRRTLAVDENYMFTVAQEVENKSGKPVTLYPYALIRRHGKPKTEGFYILHEGLVGFMGKDGLQEIDYDKAIKNVSTSFKQQGGWLGFTDKYWAAVLVPDQQAHYEAHFSKKADKDYFQTDYLLGPVTVTPGAKQAVTGHFFAGAKQTAVVDGYEKQYDIRKFELLIDWGWFHFITKPLFFVLDFFYKLVGNFGVSILIVTVLIKLAFFPLANKSYESMSKMKKLQPEMERLKERFRDDKLRQQQALMDLYKKEKVNPLAGCLPILIQIPVFFALYKVLFITIEMRHAPFFGWIQDLSAPDPTSIFNLFGLIPWTPPEFLLLGIWPLLMGISMYVQMKLNPAPPDPVQQQIFAWMPVVFTFLLASFPAGLLIYWTWNNILSITQQWVIMERNGVKVELWGNMGINKLTNKITNKISKMKAGSTGKS